MNINRILAQAQGYARMGVMTASVFENMCVSLANSGLRSDLLEKAEESLKRIFCGSQSPHSAHRREHG